MSNPLEVAISCTDCVRRNTPDCADCLVTFVEGSEPETLVLRAVDARVISLFHQQGMVPDIRFADH
jgi:hypothetical protein